MSPGVRRFEDLVCWQLALELKRLIYLLTNRESALRERDFVYQIRKSARSAPSNIAEGFARFRPKEFARFLEIAIASLEETKNHLTDAVDLGCITQAERDDAYALARRAIGASMRLMLDQKRRAQTNDRVPTTLPRAKREP